MPLEYFFDEYYEFIFNNYSKTLKGWREKNKLSINKAAKIIGVNPNTLSKWERGVGYPDRVMYEKIKKAIN